MGYDAWVTTHGLQRLVGNFASRAGHETRNGIDVHGDFNDAHYVYGDVATTFYRKDSKFMVRTGPGELAPESRDGGLPKLPRRSCGSAVQEVLDRFGRRKGKLL